MAIFNKYELDVDLKREYTIRQVSFAQGESALLVFKIFDDGEQFNLSTITEAKLFQRTAGCMLLENECEITVDNGITIIRCVLEKLSTIETGFNTMSLVLYEGEYAVNIKPFNVMIYPNLQGTAGSYLELIQDMMEIIENMTLDLNNTIKIIEKGAPNGVASLSENGTIPLAQMPPQFNSYLDHITHTVYENQVHGMLINEDGILQYRTPYGVQNAGFSPEATGNGGGANHVLNASVTVNDGVATVLYTGIPTLVAQKWAEGERNLAYFTIGGNNFTGNSFNVSKVGLYTLWYKDSNSNTYILLFNVTQSQLKAIDINLEINNGEIVVNTSESISVIKWDTGERDIVYFQYNGNIVNGNTFNVTVAGTYTLYVKTVNGAEYLKVFQVNASDLPSPDTTPPTITTSYELVENGAKITINATDAESGVDYIETPELNKIFASSMIYSADANGNYKFSVYDKAGNKAEATVTVTGITSNKPSITLSTIPENYTNQSILVKVVASSNIPSGYIVYTYWEEGIRDESYFFDKGNYITGNTFTVDSNDYYTVYAEDNYGNKNVEVIAVRIIDRLAPTIITTITPENLTSGNVTIQTRMVDSLSGLKEAKWAVGDRNKEYFRTNANGTVYNGVSFDVSANGMYTIYAIDNVGNDIVDKISISNIATSPPIITLNYTPDNYTNGNVKIIPTITVNSGTLAVKKWDTGTRNISYFENAGTTFTGNFFEVSSNDNYTVYAKDSAGNATVAVIRITTIDKERPTISATLISSTATSKTYRIVASDTLSGLNRIQFPDFTTTEISPATYTITTNGLHSFLAYDNAGNMRSDSVYIDDL